MPILIHLSTYQETHPSVLCGINDEADGREHDAPNKSDPRVIPEPEGG